MNKPSLKKLHLEIAALLEKALSGSAQVSYQDTMIKVIVSREDFENRFGAVLHHMQQLIDEQYPYRAADLSILVRDSGSRFEHVFKIWKTSERSGNS